MVILSKLRRNLPLLLLLLVVAGAAVWLLNPGDPVHGITTEEIDRVLLLDANPENCVELTEEEWNELVPLLSQVRLWGIPTTSMANYDGMVNTFCLVLKNGKELAFSAGGGWYILNGVGYQAGYDSALGQAIDDLYCNLFEKHRGMPPGP